MMSEISLMPSLPAGFHYRGQKPLSNDSKLVRYIPNELEVTATFEMKYNDCFYLDDELKCHCILCGMIRQPWSVKLSMDNQEQKNFTHFSKHLFAVHPNELTYSDYLKHTKNFIAIGKLLHQFIVLNIYCIFPFLSLHSSQLILNYNINYQDNNAISLILSAYLLFEVIFRMRNY